VLAFDFRDYNRPDHDVTAAVAELRHRGVTKVVLVGSSMGGTAVRVGRPRAVWGGGHARQALGGALVRRARYQPAHVWQRGRHGPQDPAKVR
jgi:hypothetical protein